MTAIREPAVAGYFYPGAHDELAASVGEALQRAKPGGDIAPKALIAPHAGYRYSGPVAASAYAQLREHREKIRRVILLGPSHRVAFQGLALSSAEVYRTPLGDIPVEAAPEELLEMPGVGVLDQAHESEHSLEVHLPFLQAALDRFSLVPVVAGDASAELVAAVLSALWGGPETLIVISSDLSHYLDYRAARKLDQKTCDAIERLDEAAIESAGACGRVPIRGLLVAAREHGLAVRTLDLRNSGDTAGDKSRVVGYGAWVFFEDNKRAPAG